MEDFNSYGSIFSSLLSGVPQTSSLDLENTIKNSILKMIYYSSAIEGNKADLNTAELLFNSNLFDGKASISDYMELMNHKSAYESLIIAAKTKITKEDILDIHSQIMYGILGIYSGKKRFRVNFGSYVTPPPVGIDAALVKIATAINIPESNNLIAFMNALKLHLDLFYVHPFEDGNKRTCRLFMNLYLLRNQIRPFIITLEDKETYFESLRVYDFGKYSVPFIADAIKVYFKDYREELIRALKHSTTGNPKEFEARQLLLAAFGEKLPIDTFDKVVVKLSATSETVRGALWLLSQYKLDREQLFIESLQSADPSIRALALWAIWKVDAKKYYNVIKKQLLTDPIADNRILAFTALTYAEINFNRDVGLLETLAKKENDEGVLARICETMAYYKNHEVAAATIKTIMEKHTSVTIAVRASSARTNFEDENLIINSINQFKTGPVSEFTIIKLSQNKKINLPGVAKALISVADREPEIRNMLLYTLAQLEYTPINEYERLLDNVLKSQSSKDIEKAYAISTLDKIKGYEFIKTNYNLMVENPHHAFEDAAIFIAYKNANGADINPNLVFNTKDSRTITIQAIELNKMINGNQFGSYFLELYKTGLAK